MAQPRKKVVYDLGCGANKVPGSIGVDLTTNGDAEIAHDLNVFPYPIKSRSADIIHMASVLEHIRYPRECLDEVNRILKKGGRLHISVPFVFRYHESPEDHWRWTHTGIKLLLESAGFRVISVKNIHGMFTSVAKAVGIKSNSIKSFCKYLDSRTKFLPHSKVTTGYKVVCEKP